MAASPALIAGWARSAVAPHGGAFSRLHAHDIAGPVLRALLQRSGVDGGAVDAVVMGNALGAGGNTARMVALAAGLPDRCAAFTVDTQCCAGLDAIAMGVGLLASGQASVVIAGGVEAWSRSPIRQVRPLREGDPAVSYERPAFAPDPARDPDLLVAAAHYAAMHNITRVQQDAYAQHSHQKAVEHCKDLSNEIVEILGLRHDAYPRSFSAARAVRMPVAARASEANECVVSTLAISPRADGAAMVLLATPAACKALGLSPQARWLASASVGCDPAMPLIAAELAARQAMQRTGVHSASGLHTIEMHDAFAVQGLSFCHALGISTDRINRKGGGIARGHPIGASGAVALVRLLVDLQKEGATGARGLAAVAGAGGIGAAVVVERI
jgi:acetyl-CoA C-acetyltransferase